MYRGEHHPTDILGSLLFAALWLTAATVLIKPNADGRGRARTGASGGRRRPVRAGAPVPEPTARRAAS
jgi:undecaprenyl-diphosphatase